MSDPLTKEERALRVLLQERVTFGIYPAESEQVGKLVATVDRLVSREARLVALLERAQPIVFTFKLDRSVEVGGDRRAAVNAWLADAAKELES